MPQERIVYSVGDQSRLNGRKKFFKEMKGILYIMKYGDENIYKIGISRDRKSLKVRLNTLNSSTYIEIILIHSFNVFDALTYEKFFHKKFKNNRIKNEWFKFEEDQLDVIKKCCEGMKIEDIRENYYRLS